MHIGELILGGKFFLGEIKEGDATMMEEFNACCTYK